VKKKATAKKRRTKMPCVDCGGLGVILFRFWLSDILPLMDANLDEQRATIYRCDTCRKYADNHEASQAIEGKARLYDEIMAVRPEHLRKRGAA
jgi:predicted RNA-binding Zn-ribbon protein involved in translation (DUF1610 family)